jgi:hypothetical protein
MSNMQSWLTFAMPVSNGTLYSPHTSTDSTLLPLRSHGYFSPILRLPTQTLRRFSTLLVSGVTISIPTKIHAKKSFPILN